MDHKLLTVEVVYAASNRQLVMSLQVSLACTVEGAIYQSGILKQFPEIDLTINKVGIFSKPVSLATVLNEGDRIEIYRPLMVDPKQARKQRAKVQKNSQGEF